jgi:DNA modification methylase
VRGEEAFTHALRSAMEAVDEEHEELLIHGVHSYPARMHPAVARRALERFAPGPGATLLDPFCGSGTTLVEGMAAGWRCLGSDLNPLALDLARVKCSRMGEKARERFGRRVLEVAEASEERVRGRVDVRAKLSKAERDYYDVHVLKEFAGLLEEVNATEHDADRRALRMVFSSMVVKFSRQRSDTDERLTQKRVRKGLVTEFFVRKSEELLRAWHELDDACPDKTRRPRIVKANAMRLGETLSGDFKADLILTSPPYGGTYDYAHHHRRRFAWLGYKQAAFESEEIGSRRRLAKAKKGVDRWDTELLAVLEQMRERLVPDGLALLLIGDGHVGGTRVPADRQLERLAPRVGLEFVGVASQSRPDFAGGAPREEHLVALLAP